MDVRFATEIKTGSIEKMWAAEGSPLLRDTPGRRPPCLHERTFAGQRTANGITVSCPRYRGDRIGEYVFPYPIGEPVVVRRRK